jgi:type IV secretion system protein VirD4
MNSTSVLFGQLLLTALVMIAGMWFSTQWAAHALGYQMRLGAPWFVLSGIPIYYPWRLFEWWYAYESYTPAIFNKAGTIAASSGLIAALTAIASSIWRARQSRLVTTYGSARWATPRDVNAAGLHRTAGVFLGKTP